MSKPRHKRFDESFSQIQTILGIIIGVHLAISNTPQDRISYAAVYILSLSLWIFGNLLGGEHEYFLKLSSLLLTISSVLGLLGASLIALDPDLVFLNTHFGDLLAIGIAPLFAFGVSSYFSRYLKETIPDFRKTIKKLFLIFAVYLVVTGYLRILSMEI